MKNLQWSHVQCYPLEILTHYQVTKPAESPDFLKCLAFTIEFLFLANTFKSFFFILCLCVFLTSERQGRAWPTTYTLNTLASCWHLEGGKGGERGMTLLGHSEATRMPVTSFWPPVRPRNESPSASCHSNHAHSLASVNSYYAYTHYYY